MINLQLKSEYHFDTSDRGYGRLTSIAARIKALGQSAAALTDCTTFGHVRWIEACKKVGIQPLLGVQIRIPLTDGGVARSTLIAKNNKGLRELYELASLSASDRMTLPKFLKSSANVIKLTGTLHGLTKRELFTLKNAYADISPSTPPDLRTEKLNGPLPILAVGDNRYPCIEDRQAFDLFGGSKETHPQHILSEREARVYLRGLPERAYTLSDELAASCNVSLPNAVNLTVEGDLEKLCRANIKARIGRWSKRYEQRLTLELKMIKEKQFESYFLIISDMVRWAKKHMIVGPARGSAAGSLVCYLAYITDIDPIVHDLLFERFIDVTRKDLPDIDLDFPDTKRDLVIEYLQKRYGADHVVHVGTVSTFQPKSIIRMICKRMEIKIWELQPLLDVMVERASGDSRGELCLLDTLEGMEAGKAAMARFPQLRTATAFEGHATNAGTHAAGIVVCAEPVNHFCTVDARNSTAQIDKADAEKINLLKIDVLGLRTLSVLEYALEHIPGKRIDLTQLPLDDKATFDIFNKQRWAGIFQFEGDALQMLQKMIKVELFSDIVAIGALGRPGPLNSGGGQEWCDRRMGRQGRLGRLHHLCDEHTAETYGLIVFQEQVMSISRKVGQLEWEDVTEIRKTMSKSKGEEHFSQYWVKFLKGALAQGVSKDDAQHIWGSLTTHGAWSFNKSHAVAYGLISYWCAYIKAHYPLQFAAATLRHAKNEQQTIDLLRELTEEGIEYVAFDPKTSNVNWEVIKGKLTGGFINLKGIGEATAKELVATRGKWTDKQKEKIANAEVLYGDIYPAQKRFGWLYKNPKVVLPQVNHLCTMKEIDDYLLDIPSAPDQFFFIAMLADKTPRDLNEYVFQVKRVQDGKSKMHTDRNGNLSKETAYCNVVMEDDTGRRGMTIGANMYADVGHDIVENGVVGRSWYAMRARINKIKHLNITWAKDITNLGKP